MDYTELFPVNQDDQLQQAMTHYHHSGFHDIRPANFCNAGMGSGKTRLMQSLNIGDITYVVAPNETLENQLKTAFRSGSLEQVSLIDGMGRAKQEIEAGIKSRKKVIVFFSNIASSGRDFSPSAKAFLPLISFFKDFNQICLFDEADQQLTYLTGGINAKLDHSNTAMKACERVLAQINYSLNIFDNLRANDVKCICFSGTMNNMICSKLPSMGYSQDQISILNVAPMKYLYENLKIIPIDMSSFANIAPYLQELERMPANMMGLMGFPSEKDIADFLLWYRDKYGYHCPHVKITCATDGDNLSTLSGMKKLCTAKYIIGINMVLTGFDLSTHIKGRQFALTILYRKMSDKISQPLSKNPEHPLHNEVAATMRQFIARARQGGTCLIPCAYYDIGTLYDNLQQVFNTIRDGRNESAWVGPPKVSQVERHAQCQILGLKQNLKKHYDRPIVAEIIRDLASFPEGRDFKRECDTDIVDPYWIKAIQDIWEGLYAERARNKMTDEEFDAAKPSMIAKLTSTRGPLIKKGTGFKEGRDVNTAIEEEVKSRSAGICAHCSEKVEDDEEGQICHVRRHDDAGSYTADNLVFGHKGCDGLYDNEHRFIHKSCGDYYLAKKYYEHQPDPKQWSCISPRNIAYRWNWTKAKMGYSDDTEFMNKLLEKGYKYFNA